MITFESDGLRARLTELEAEMGAPGSGRPGAGREGLSEHARLSRRLERYETLKRDLPQRPVLVRLGQEAPRRLTARR